MASSVLSDFQTADTLMKPVRTLEMAWNIQDKISDLEQKIAKLQEEKSQIIQEHLQAGIKQDGPFSIKETRRTRRKVDEVALEAMNPELFDRVSKITRTVSVKDLDDAIGKENSSEWVITTETVAYEIDWDYRHGVEQ